ncbi:MAG: radical SAM protein [Planctomycetota bacterium]
MQTFESSNTGKGILAETILAEPKESPDYVQISAAAAMTLGFQKGRFWRGAQLKCINLLQTYRDGCRGSCAYCGLNRHRQGDRSFIRVTWPVHTVAEIVDALNQCAIAERVCISMVTHRRALSDLLEIAQRISSGSGLPISGLITPTLVSVDDLAELRRRGVDKIGIAIDAATPDLFKALRASPGPHRWEHYWAFFEKAKDVFGRGNVGSHFICGLGETERDMALALQRVHDLGGVNHLFSFYPEAGSAMEDRQPPPIDQYRRVQLAAEIIDAGMARADDFAFDQATGRILSFGILQADLDRVIEDGNAFMTRGCTGRDGRTACNRPFGNSPPGPGVRNYPFPPNRTDIARIRRQLAGEWVEKDRFVPRGCASGRVQTAWRNREILFSAPAIKHFDTDEFKNSGKPVFVPVSVTGKECRLGCAHCRGRLLESMYEARTPDDLWSLMRGLKEKGCRGLLLTGGCDENGLVPITPFCDMLARIKNEMGMKTAVHVRLLDQAQAEAVGRSSVDVAMIDVIGSDDVLHSVYRLPGKSAADIERSLDLLEGRGVPLAPHIVLGQERSLANDRAALDMLRGRKLKGLVFVLVMALSKRDGVAPVDVDEVRRFFRSARRKFPDAPLLLGCARPMGRIQFEIDCAALDAGFDGIAYPAEGTVRKAGEMGRRPRYSELCCSLLM